MADNGGIQPMDIDDSEDSEKDTLNNLNSNSDNLLNDEIIMQAQTDDGQTFDLDRNFLKHNKTLMNLYVDISGFDITEEIDTVLQTPISAVEGYVMDFVVEYTKTHKKCAIPKYDNEHYDSIEMPDMDTAVFNSVFEESKEKFFKIIKAANYLDNQLLLDNTCKFVANLLRGKSPDEIRSTFSIKNDIPKEKESQIIQINQWVNEI